MVSWDKEVKFSYWNVFVWCIGSVVATALLFLAVNRQFDRCDETIVALEGENVRLMMSVKALRSEIEELKR